ncbi:hypothetical protein ACWCPK_22075 [Streptomyces sp. NPDC001953]
MSVLQVYDFFCVDSVDPAFRRSVHIQGVLPEQVLFGEDLDNLLACLPPTPSGVCHRL